MKLFLFKLVLLSKSKCVVSPSLFAGVFARFTVFFAVVFSTAVLSGCGRTVIILDEQTVDLRQAINNEIYAEQYLVDDYSCIEGQGLDRVEQATVFRWQGERVESHSVTASGFESKTSLSSPAISRTIAGYFDRSTCDSAGQKCKLENVFNPGMDVKLCRKNYAYPRESVEGIALTSLQYLSDSYDFYTSLTGTRPIGRAGLFVLPRFEKQIGDHVRVKTDNLSYSAATNRGPVFFVYPKGKLIAQLGYNRDLNLWEIPWAMHHEYGHHVFRNHLVKEKKDFSLNGERDTVDVLIEMAERRRQGGTGLTESNLLTTTSTVRKVDGVDHYLSVNETFADLYAFYQNNEKSSDLNGVDCFERSRQVESALFHTGDEKVLTKKVLEIYQRPMSVTAVYCKQIDYQDSHIIGAILAHQINRILDASDELLSADLALTKGIPSRTERKMVVLLTWVEQLAKIINLDHNVDSVRKIQLDDMIRPLFAVLAGEKRQLGQKACQIIQEGLPGIADKLLEGKDGFQCEA